MRHIWISQTALDLTSGETELRQQAGNLKSVAQLNHFCYLQFVVKSSSLTRLEICQKFYTTKFLAQRSYTLRNAYIVPIFVNDRTA